MVMATSKLYISGAAQSSSSKAGNIRPPLAAGLNRKYMKRYKRINRENIQNWSLYILVMLWIVRNTILVRRRPGDLYTVIDPMAFFQIAIVVTILVILLIGPGSRYLSRFMQTSLKFYFFYYGLAAASMMWSLSPQFSIYRAVEVLALSMAVLIFCNSGSNVEENIRRTIIIIWSVVMMIAFGTALHGSVWNLRNNTLGAAAAMAACFFAAWILADRDIKDRKRLIQGIIGVLIVFLSLSLASWWAFWFGICYVALFSRRKAEIVILFILGAVLFFSLGTDTRDNLLIRDKQYEDLNTLHGRKIIWEYYMAVSEERPVLGFGFSVGARELGSVYTTNTHNMFFGALIGLGWTGVGCWIFFFGFLAMELIRYRHALHPAWLGCAAALAAGTLNSMSLSIIAEQWNPSTTVFVALLGLHISFLQEAKPAGRSKPFLSPWYQWPGGMRGKIPAVSSFKSKE